MILAGRWFARLVAAGVICAAATLPAVVAVAPQARAVDDSLGTPGFCPDDDGVTVVVDFQRLGGRTIVRCAPGSEPRTGLEVLQDAGFDTEGVQRWGEGFVCRIEDRPSASEQLPVVGDEGYREACVDTPPATAFWGYWRADEGGEWRYSQQGVKSTEVEPGGFEGWSFSLNAADGVNPPPGIPPDRPAPAVASAGWTGGGGSPDVDDSPPAGSAWSSALGLGAVAGVAALAAVMSVRRRRHRVAPEPRT